MNQESDLEREVLKEIENNKKKTEKTIPEWELNQEPEKKRGRPKKEQAK